MRKGSFKIIISVFTMLLAFESCSLDDIGASKSRSFFADLFKSDEKAKPLILSVNEYMKWVEDTDNGLRVDKKIADFTYTALYKPYEYMALNELKSNTVSAKEIHKKTEEYEGLQYYTFRITSDNQSDELLRARLSSEAEYYSRLEYFSFKMQNDLKLIDGKDTLDCILFHFERIYGLAPYATFVLGFPKQNEQQEKKQNYNDKTLKYEDNIFGAGNVYITIKAENLNRIPQLKFN